MFVLNFISPQNETLLLKRQKTVTIRPGDIRGTYKENSVVWITFGRKYEPKRKLYLAMIDRTLCKKFSEITKDDLAHQDPEMKTVEELIALFEHLYEKKLTMDDTVTIIHFSELS